MGTKILDRRINMLKRYVDSLIDLGESLDMTMIHHDINKAGELDFLSGVLFNWQMQKVRVKKDTFFLALTCLPHPVKVLSLTSTISAEFKAGNMYSLTISELDNVWSARNDLHTFAKSLVEIEHDLVALAEERRQRGNETSMILAGYTASLIQDKEASDRDNS